MNRLRLRHAAFVAALLLAVSAGRTATRALDASPAVAQSQTDAAQPPIPASAVIQPDELARTLQSGAAEKPLVFQVGFRFLYRQAHIPGSEYLGPGSRDEGLKLLRDRVAGLPRAKAIVLYCGCCPWIKCPNVKPAYDALRALGFTQVKILRIEENFGANWVSKGYPIAKGE
jgi:thiosulfate/3-mercaptopyruvate sulfurtransferase